MSSMQSQRLVYYAAVVVLTLRAAHWVHIHSADALRDHGAMGVALLLLVAVSFVAIFALIGFLVLQTLQALREQPTHKRD